MKVRTIFKAFTCVVAGFAIGQAYLQIQKARTPRYFTCGRTDGPQAKIYGWAYEPHAEVGEADPDTGDYWNMTLSDHGWKDIDRASCDVLVVGDSVTWGLGVPPELIYTRLAERRTGINIATCGVGGWATDQEMTAVSIESPRLRPRIVVIQWCRNDLGGNDWPCHCSADNPLALAKPFRWQLVDGSLQFDPTTQPARECALSRPCSKNLDALACAEMLQCAGLVRCFRARFCVLVPEDHRMATAFRGCDLPVVEVEKFEPFRTDPHPNRRGHEQLAEGLIRCIEAAR